MSAQERFESRLERAKAASLGQVLVKAARLVNRHAIEKMRSDPRYSAIRYKHLSIMPHLDLEGTRVTVLAERMEMTKQGVGQLVSEMEDQGILERLPDPTDGRAKLVRLTAAGRASIFDGLRALGGTEDLLREVLGQSELTRLHRSLLKVVEALDAG